MKKSKQKILLSGLIIAFSAIGCASSEKKDPCPTEAEEPISVCRAREKCLGQNSSVGVGVGLGFGNFGVGFGRSQSTARYERCLDQELTEQQKKAKLKESNASEAQTSESPKVAPK